MGHAGMLFHQRRPIILTLFVFVHFWDLVVIDVAQDDLGLVWHVVVGLGLRADAHLFEAVINTGSALYLLGIAM